MIEGLLSHLWDTDKESDKKSSPPHNEESKNRRYYIWLKFKSDTHPWGKLIRTQRKHLYSKPYRTMMKTSCLLWDISWAIKGLGIGDRFQCASSQPTKEFRLSSKLKNAGFFPDRWMLLNWWWYRPLQLSPIHHPQPILCGWVHVAWWADGQTALER